jgi:ABC-2 type transport system ATP-binding protein
LIEASDLTKRFGSFLALDRVNFHVARGRVVGFLGLNGAGKTTTLRILSCYMPPTSGWVKVAGCDTVRQSDQVRRRIGYLPERVPLYDDLRVHEYLRFRARLKGVRGRDAKGAVDRVIGQCGLEPKRTSPIGNLSKGYRQRVGIADALVHDPELLLLDEPTSGLDPDQRIELRGLIRELGDRRTVLLSTHILPEAEAVCHDVVIIHRGQIRAAETLADLQGSAGHQVRVVHRGPPLDSAPDAATVSTDEASDTTTILLDDRVTASRTLAQAVHAGREVLEMVPLAPTLEQIFMGFTTGREEVL